MKKNEINVGGQALIEGVMMRGKDDYFLALLKESGEIKVIHKKIKSITKKYKFLKLPFFRGIIALFQNLTIGMKSLTLSANEALPEKDKIKSKKTEGITIFFMVFLSIVFGMGIFVAIPNIVIEVMGVKETAEPMLFHLISGLLRLIMFVLYVYGISLMKDIKRVFQFHGAEHKAVNAYEANKELNLNNAKECSTYHPRCGTSFLFFVFFISIFIFSLVPIALLWLFPWFEPLHIIFQKIILIGSHIVLLPVVASISYELIKLAFKKQDNPILKAMNLPGYYIQKLTTKEPDDKQIEVALTALKEVVKLISPESNKELNNIVDPKPAMVN